MQREIKVEELAVMLAVSPLTIRRDLESLAEASTIIRTHGGCLAVGRAALETEYHKKVGINFTLKQSIGRAAARQIVEGDTILLNDGTTTFHLGAYLAQTKNLVVYTNSLALITEVSRSPSIRLFVLGGEYNEGSYSLRGALLEEALDMLLFDTVFLGADCVDQRGRCMVGTAEEAHLTKRMLRAGKKKVLLADSTKAGRATSHCAYGSLSDFDIWITNREMDSQLFALYKEMVRIELAE